MHIIYDKVNEISRKTLDWYPKYEITLQSSYPIQIYIYSLLPDLTVTNSDTMKICIESTEQDGSYMGLVIGLIALCGVFMICQAVMAAQNSQRVDSQPNTARTIKKPDPYIETGLQDSDAQLLDLDEKQTEVL